MLVGADTDDVVVLVQDRQHLRALVSRVHFDCQLLNQRPVSVQDASEDVDLAALDINLCKNADAQRPSI